jgi:exodeoxyribonuclease V alpha subunit
LQPSTIHRLLRRRPGPREVFRYNRDNPVPFDTVVVDEMSMVSLPLMARLMEAIGPATRVILVGDPDQLASVEAGAVFGDLVRMRQGGDGLVTLQRNHRFAGQLKRLAEAVRDGRVDDALAALDSPMAGEAANVEFIESADGRAAFGAVRADVAAQAHAVHRASRAGDADAALGALSEFRVLCAHREGPAGVARWSGLIDRWSAEATGRPSADADPWYVGRPLLVTRNDYDLGVFNGETGVVVQREGRPLAVIDQGRGRPEFAHTQLSDVETLHAMTVHKAQGSQYRRVTVVLPPPDSPLLTRELLYTAITRTQDKVRIVGTREAVQVAVSREVRRASGLGR